MNKITTPLLLIAAVGVIGTAQAQNAKPATETITMNKQMTRQELRACMKLQDDIKIAAASIEADKAKLQEDKLKLTGGGNSEQLKALKDPAAVGQHAEALARLFGLGAAAPASRHSSEGGKDDGARRVEPFSRRKTGPR